MSEIIKISSTGWLAIYLPNDNVAMFDLNDVCSWQYLQIESKKCKNFNDLNRNLVKFSPNGELLVVNSADNQLLLYMKVDFEKYENWWQLKRIISMENRILALDLNNESLYVADKIGDIYKIDLLVNSNDMIKITVENCIIQPSSMLFDLIYFGIKNKESSILTAGQDTKIHFHNYPNSSKNEKSCIGHTEFVYYIKLIDQNRLLSASGDGTFRLWRLPNCQPYLLLHSKSLVLTQKQVFYTELYDPKGSLLLEHYRENHISRESSSDLSSTIDYSIWKMDVASCDCPKSEVYIAFSLFGHRLYSIYLTSLSTMAKLDNEHRQLTFDSSYGTIIDYCFPSREILFNDGLNRKCFLYVLFSSNIFIKVDILSILSCTQLSIFVKQDDYIQDMNRILSGPEFHLMNYNTNTDAIIFQKLFKNFVDSNNNYHLKRPCEVNEGQEQSKRQALS